jgi:hypothetical protein
VRVLRLLPLALKSHAALLLSQLGNLCLALLDDRDVNPRPRPRFILVKKIVVKIRDPAS